MTEDVLEPQLPIVDPHHHLWDHPQNRYLLDELLADTGSGHNVTATVFVECMSMYRADGPDAVKPVGETEFVNGVAAMSASGRYGATRVAAAIVSFAKDVARGLRIRCDWGPQYIADAWINEVKWLGMTITPSYVGEPECNGVIERFMRTLKEQCLYLHRFQSLAEARRIISEFIARYNTEWLIERLGHQTPVAARARALAA